MKTLFAVLAMLIVLTGNAAAQTASFSQFQDATPGKYFDATQAVDDGSGTLTIPLGSGTDGTFAMNNDNTFYASSLSGTAAGFWMDWVFRPKYLADTFSVWVTAPDGYVIDTITYRQTGLRSTSRGSATGATTTMSLNGVPLVASAPEVTATIVSPQIGLQGVLVSVTTSLSAANGGTLVSSASLTATVMVPAR